MRNHYDFSEGIRGKHASACREGTRTAVAPSPARACTRLVLENRIRTILDEFAERVCPDSVSEFLGECLRRWEEEHLCRGG